MSCRFCGQWNSPSSPRCVFCQNDPRAAEDTTASGTLRETNVKLTKVDMRTQSAHGGKRFELVDLLIWGVILAAGAIYGIFCHF